MGNKKLLYDLTDGQKIVCFLRDKDYSINKISKLFIASWAAIKRREIKGREKILLGAPTPSVSDSCIALFIQTTGMQLLDE